MGTDYSVEVECQHCHTLIEFDPTDDSEENGEEFNLNNESHRLWFIKKFGSIKKAKEEVEETSCYTFHRCKCGQIVAVSMIYLGVKYGRRGNKAVEGTCH